MDKEHIVYILKCKDNTLYTGYTVDLNRRYKMHTMGKGAKYTRGRGPLEIVYVKKFPSKSAAMKEEHAIKQLSKQEKEHLIRESQKEGEADASKEEL